MDVHVHSSPSTQINNLKSQIYSPITGIIKSVGYILPSYGDSDAAVLGADLTGVHNLVGLPEPKPGSYHIGGTGFLRFEPLIRTFGESIERYAGVVSALSLEQAGKFSSYNELAEENSNSVIDMNYLDIYNQNQLLSSDIPFKKFDRTSQYKWIELPDLANPDCKKWAPVQKLSIGYAPESKMSENRFDMAVSSGTAAHTDPRKAIISSILELIQVDSAIGHWYGNLESVKIILDNRTRNLTNILNRFSKRANIKYDFFLLPSPGFNVFSVACIAEDTLKRKPRLGVGLGISLNLEEALYKSLLEGIGVFSLAKWNLINDAFNEPNHTSHLDFDSSVATAATDCGAENVAKRFNSVASVNASDIPSDYLEQGTDELRYLVEEFKKQDMSLLFLDFTTDDIKMLGFTVSRVWSPNLLALCFPNIPPLMHPRFASYGGATRPIVPHPYP